ncbi:MAG: sensor histidine kinase [Desulfomonilaceae bacterium]
MIEEVVELYRYVAEEKNIVIRTAFSEDLQGSVDPHRIRQVLANLLDNAVKYTPDGGRVRVATLLDEASPSFPWKPIGSRIFRQLSKTEERCSPV